MPPPPPHDHHAAPAGDGTAVVAMRSTGVLAVLVTVLAGLAALVPTAAPAQAHASGQVPQARLAAEGHRVEVVWTADADDGADVLVAAGVWPEEIALRYLDIAFGGDPALLPDDAEVAAASRDPALARYLEERVRILQDGLPCPGRAAPAADFVADGAAVTFECPETVTEAVVEITLLHDRDPAYRTFSVDGTVQYAIHTADRPAHPWDFGHGAQPPASRSVITLAIAATLVVAIAGGTLWWLWGGGHRRLRRADRP